MKNKLPFLLDEEELSSWAHDYCRNIENDPELKKIYNKFRRGLITIVII